MQFDSNIIIRYLNGEGDVIGQLTAWRQEGRAFIISSVTTAEVLSLKTLDSDDIERVKVFLKTFVSIPFGDGVAEVAAKCRRVYGLGLPDAAIAATAMILEMPLVTQDKQFKRIREITVVEI